MNLNAAIELLRRGRSLAADETLVVRLSRLTNWPIVTRGVAAHVERPHRVRRLAAEQARGSIDDLRCVVLCRRHRLLKLLARHGRVYHAGPNWSERHWRNICLVMDEIQAVRDRVHEATVVQSTRLMAQARTVLQKLQVMPPPRRLAVER